MTVRAHASTDSLARLTVVVPVGPGDRVSDVLVADLTELPPEAELHLVFAIPGDAAELQALPQPDSGPERRMLTAEPGRASQQNAGAAAGARDWLWFLHADSQLTPATLPALARFIDGDGGDVLGYFELRYLDDGPALMRLNELGARLRSRWPGLPFGDQGLLLPRALFERLGGFDPTLARGEDHELIWRARRAGIRPRPVGAPLLTSARKYAAGGWSATTLATLRESWRQARQFSRTAALS